MLLTAHLYGGYRPLVTDGLTSVSSGRLQIAGFACHWILLINPPGATSKYHRQISKTK